MHAHYRKRFKVLQGALNIWMDIGLRMQGFTGRGDSEADKRV